MEGGPGDDTITGSQGADALVGGEGNDTFMWPLASPGDLVGGEAGTDTIQVLGSALADNVALGAVPFGINVAANGSTTTLQADVEEATFQAGRGADQIFIGTLAGTTLQKITLDLRATATGTTGDFYADALTVNGSNAADNISITGSAGNLTLTGLAPTIVVQNSESVRDTLTLNTGPGVDVLNAQGLGVDVIRLAVRGGDGDDILTGSLGDDVFMWSPGDDNDVIEGGLGNDMLQFAGANVAETITLNANGSRLRFTRDIASVVLDLNAVERVNFSASGGADTISFTDLSATGVKQVAIDLSSFGNPAGDAQPDTIQIAATTTTPISTALGIGTMTVTWSGVKISATGVEPANDRLIMQTTTGVPAPALSSAAKPAIAHTDEDEDTSARP